MSAAHGPELDAIAFQLAAALERYEQDAARVVDTWLDMELYQSVSGQVEQIRMYCAALPQLSVQWVELLIAHAELVHALWRQRFDGSGNERERLHAIRERHAGSLRAMHRRCLQLLAPDRPRRPGPDP